MTLQRQQRKGIAGRFRTVAVSLCVLGLPGPALAQATTERVVVNRFTGLAISGFDPVAYFTDGTPIRGEERFEAVAERAVWRFRNEGNRAAFIGHPDVYAPQFGGHDPIDVARGRVVHGTPLVFMIHDERLYLFANETSRTAFAANPEGFAASAQRRWAKLKQDLVR